MSDATAALERVAGAPPRSVRQIHGGWASFTFEMDERYIARFPRTASVAQCTQAELDLLPELAPRVDFSVPAVRWRGTREGLPFFVYESIPGRGLTSQDVDQYPGLVQELAAALRQLHSLDIAIAGSADGPGGAEAVPAGAASGGASARSTWAQDPVGTWRARYAELRSAADHRVVPLLDSDVAGRLAAAWDEFEASLTFTPALVHADLGLEHVLVDAGRLSGIIDWETARPGDPAVDFVGFHIDLGPDRTGRILDAYDPGDPALRSRIPHYVWIGAVFAVLYGLDEARSEIVRDGLEGLGERLRALR